VFPEPLVTAFADLAWGAGDSGYGDGGGGGEEGEGAVVEVGEEEDVTLGEGGEEGGLVDAVERAGFEFTHSVCMYQYGGFILLGEEKEKRVGTGKTGGGGRREGGKGEGRG